MEETIALLWQKFYSGDRAAFEQQWGEPVVRLMQLKEVIESFPSAAEQSSREIIAVSTQIAHLQQQLATMLENHHRLTSNVSRVKRRYEEKKHEIISDDVISETLQLGDEEEDEEELEPIDSMDDDEDRDDPFDPDDVASAADEFMRNEPPILMRVMSQSETQEPPAKKNHMALPSTLEKRYTGSAAGMCLWCAKNTVPEGEDCKCDCENCGGTRSECECENFFMYEEHREAFEHMRHVLASESAAKRRQASVAVWRKTCYEMFTKDVSAKELEDKRNKLRGLVKKSDFCVLCLRDGSQTGGLCKVCKKK